MRKRILSKSTYDLFLTDVRLRSYNGLNLVKQVRQEAPDTAVIIMTGYDEPLMQLEASRYSAHLPQEADQVVGAARNRAAQPWAFGANAGGRASASSADSG